MKNSKRSYKSFNAFAYCTVNERDSTRRHRSPVMHLFGAKLLQLWSELIDNPSCMHLYYCRKTRGPSLSPYSTQLLVPIIYRVFRLIVFRISVMACKVNLDNWPKTYSRAKHGRQKKRHLENVASFKCSCNGHGNSRGHQCESWEPACANRLNTQILLDQVDCDSWKEWAWFENWCFLMIYKPTV